MQTLSETPPKQLTPDPQLRPSRIMSAWRGSALEKRVSLTAFFLTLIWPVYLTVSLGPINITPARLAATGAIMVIWLYMFAVDRRMMQYIRILRYNPLMLSLFSLYIIWRLVADTGGIDPANSYILTVLDVIASGFFLITLMVVGMDSTNSIVECIFWADLLLIAIGAFELLAGFSIAPILARFSSGSSEALTAYSADVFRGDIFRVRSLSSHPILFGSFVSACLPILLHLLKHGTRGHVRILSAMFLVASPILLLASNARSALAGGLIAVAAYYLLRMVRAGRRNPIFLFLLFMVVSIGILGALATTAANGGFEAVSELIAGRNAIERSSSEARLEMLDRGMNALNFRPTSGYGDGQAAKIAGLRGAQNALTIDSYYLVVAVNFGYVGLAINALLLLTILWAGFVASTKKQVMQDQSGIAALCAASVCILTCAFTVTSSEYFIIVYALGAVSAVALARPSEMPLRKV